MGAQASEVGIYGLVDPRTNQVRYIGKSIHPQDRMRAHLKHAKTCTAPHRHHRCAWLRQLLNTGQSCTVTILEQVPTIDWQIAERAWITYGRWSGWPLTNATDGGDGSDGEAGRAAAKRLQQWWKDHPDAVANRNAAVAAAMHERKAAGGYTHDIGSIGAEALRRWRARTAKEAQDAAMRSGRQAGGAKWNPRSKARFKEPTAES